MVNVVSPPRIRSIQDRSASGLYWAAWWTSSRRASRYDHHPVAITHDQVTGRYRHPAALDRLSDPAMPTLVGPGCACSAGKDRQILFSKLIDIPDGSIDDHAPNPRNLGGYGEYFRSEARSFVHRSPVRTSNNALPLVGYPQ